MKLYTINTGYFKLDGGAMFGVVPKSIWNEINPADEKNMCSWALRCLLIEDGNRLILVDNGMGDKQAAKFFSYYYLHGADSLDKSLAKYGFNNLAKDIAQRWLNITEKVYQNTGKMMEKYNVVSSDLEAGGGEYPAQDGFGWTNGVYLALKKWMNL